MTERREWPCKCGYERITVHGGRWPSAYRAKEDLMACPLCGASRPLPVYTKEDIKGEYKWKPPENPVEERVSEKAKDIGNVRDEIKSDFWAVLKKLDAKEISIGMAQYEILMLAARHADELSQVKPGKISCDKPSSKPVEGTGREVVLFRTWQTHELYATNPQTTEINGQRLERIRLTADASGEVRAQVVQ